MLAVPLAIHARHLRFDNDAAIAEWRATGNDERNARLAAAGSQRSTLVIEHTPATDPAPGREYREHPWRSDLDAEHPRAWPGGGHRCEGVHWFHRHWESRPNSQHKRLFKSKSIIDKGWAAANGNSYKGIDGTDLSNAQEHDVHNGLYAITGEAGVDRNPGGPMTEVSFGQIVEDFASGLITLGTSNSDGKLVSDHSYALLGVNSSDQTVVVGDPEGGQKTLSFDTFQSTNINQYIAIPAFP